MKKSLFLAVAFFVTLSLCAQRIEFLRDGQYFTVVSPNGRYYAGAQDALPFYFYDVEAEENKLVVVDVPEEVSDHVYFVSGISNTGVVVGQYTDRAAYYQYPDESWTFLPIPDEITGDIAKINNVTAISPDGEMMAVSFGDFNSKDIYVYEKNAEAGDGWNMTKLPVAEVDPVYHQGAQWVKIVSISADKNKMLAQWIIDWGTRLMPVVYTRSGNTWTYEFICIENILKEGKTIVEMPEGVWNEELEEWVYNQNELLKYQQSWNEAENGYFIPGGQFTVSSNFKYFTFSWGDNSKIDNGVVPAFASAYDIETGKMYNFHQSAISTSVSNSGLVAISTPSMEEFRASYIYSVAEPEKGKTLTQYVLEKSDNVIDLTDYLNWMVENGNSHDEGTCYLASDCNDNRLMSYQLNYATGVYETFFISFDMTSAVKPVVDDSLLSVYPNPTNGKLFVAETLENVEIFDLTGRKVYSVANVENVIDLSCLNEGLYVMKAVAANNQISVKISIVK